MVKNKEPKVLYQSPLKQREVDNKMKVLVFDFDGTIADSKKLYVDIIRDSLLKASYIYPRSSIIRALGPKLEESLLNIRKFDRKTLKKLSREINGFVTEKAKSLKVCRNVKRTIRKLKKSRKYKIILLTNSVRGFARAFLKNNGMEKDFDIIMGSEDFGTKEDAIKKIARRFKMRTRDIIYVGDREMDFRVARHVGSKIIMPYACSWEKTRIMQRKYSKVRIQNLGKMEKILNSKDYSRSGR